VLAWEDVIDQASPQLTQHADALLDWLGELGDLRGHALEVDVVGRVKHGRGRVHMGAGGSDCVNGRDHDLRRQYHSVIERCSKQRTGSSVSVTRAEVVDRIMGTRISTGADRVSGSKSGMKAKSMVEESLTALRLRLVLK
jgi:hypothetical protein